MYKASQLLYLSASDISSLNMTMTDIIALLEEAFIEKGNGSVQALPKIELHPRLDDNFINALVCSFPKYHAAGIKWISAYPSNKEKGLPYLSGLVILNNPDNGMPIAVMEAGVITALRTGAVTGLAAKYLARPDSECAAILGCGVQARTQLEAIMAACGKLKLIKAYDVVPAAREGFCREMSERFQVEVQAVSSPRDAVIESDIIITAGPIFKQPQPVIEASWLKEGCFGAPIDYDSYWQQSAFEAATRIYVDDVDQFEQHRQFGYFRTVPPVFGDLGQLISGQIVGRKNKSEIIIAINLGLSLEDIAVGALVYRLALQKGIGSVLPH